MMYGFLTVPLMIVNIINKYKDTELKTKISGYGLVGGLMIIIQTECIQLSSLKQIIYVKR